jgi:hypothetical protein
MKTDPDIGFDPRLIPDRALAEFRRLSLSKVIEASPEFGEWLHGWLDVEQFWRGTDPHKRPAGHLVALPPVDRWTDAQLGRALRAVHVLGYQPAPESFAWFIDRCILAVVAIAAERLEGRADG